MDGNYHAQKMGQNIQKAGYKVLQALAPTEAVVILKDLCDTLAHGIKCTRETAAARESYKMAERASHELIAQQSGNISPMSTDMCFTKKGLPSLICLFCTYVFRTEEQWNQHMLNSHRDKLKHLVSIM